MPGLLQKIDPTFEARSDQPYMATNSKGFEVDMIRREAMEGDPRPLRMTEDVNDF